MAAQWGLGLVWRWKDLGSIQTFKCPDSPFVHVAISRASSLIRQADSTQAVRAKALWAGLRMAHTTLLRP